MISDLKHFIFTASPREDASPDGLISPGHLLELTEDFTSFYPTPSTVLSPNVPVQKIEEETLQDELTNCKFKIKEP